MREGKTGWSAVRVDRWPLHVVQDELVESVLADAKRRGHVAEKVVAISVYGLDRSGACRVDRPLEQLELRGLMVGIPSEHVTHFLARVRELPSRPGVAGPYCKLHTYFNCLVVSPAARSELERALARLEATAERRAEAFYAGLREETR